MSEQNTQPEDELEWVSKTQRKQESEALQKLGRQLTEMGDQLLLKLPLDESLLEAIQLAKRIRNKREGYRRQIQYIGKLMRQRDCDDIIKAIALIEAKKQQDNQAFHQLENTRDAIIAEGDSAIQQFIDDYPQADRQRLRQLSRGAQREQKQNKPPKSARELFKYLREIAESSAE
ncbi:ribosome-associated protein [Neiella sp. HB171785]|uniref:Dual-action ribosomal maturation protein DarP n=1 Tax=Neiella litorisoli TaxID=2771431 RepID=A0A8J6UES2_9GAMM|nr:ribosome biogenesis factor YjgA [Neiella litorisoli]MBD1389879.1 ribosome-associated protein [Neiella litorisoli]